MKIQIGKIQLENNVLLAPMSGVTDLPFRKLVKNFGASLVISEMIASRAMIMQTKDSLKKCQKDDAIFPMSVQLAGCDPEVMAEAAKINEDLGADIIDINFGCPVKKVVNGFAGSALMRDEGDCKLRRMLEVISETSWNRIATSKGCKVPMSVGAAVVPASPRPPMPRVKVRRNT